MRLEPAPKSDGTKFVVFASGWGGLDHKEPQQVGVLKVNTKDKTASFIPEGPWADGTVIKEFSGQSVEEIPERENVWVRWLLDLGSRAIQGRHNQLWRYV